MTSARDPAPGDPIPCATYRLQLNADFGLRDAARLVPYLAQLGVSHVYCSPYLRARSGSPHGYDITDHAALNPEIGNETDLEAFVAVLRAHGMGQILDFVPNHMGIGQADNAWWLDVLEYGAASPFADHFDVDWRPAKPELRGKVLAPFLGDHYGRVLERGELRLAFDAEHGSLSVWYHEHRFPVTPRAVARLLAPQRTALASQLGAGHAALGALDAALADLAEGPRPGAAGPRAAARRDRAERGKRELARLAGAEPALRSWIEEVVASFAGDAAPRERLHRLLEVQHYRLAFWRVAADEINYRRFFDINELAGLRMERRDVFDRTHARVLGWIASGQLDGLRIDHVDGLYDPRGYCRRLREAAGGRPFYLVLEKILAHHESLRREWPVDGTTGYEFLNLVAGLFVDPAGDAPLADTWRHFAPEAPPFDDEVYACKKHVMNFLLGGELQVLANDLDRLSEAHWSTRDFTLTTLREALKEVVACFPVYRSYVDARGANADDRRDIDWAVAQAKRRSSDPDPTLFEWIREILTTDLVRGPARTPSGIRRRDLVRWVMRFQQYSGPVMAKSLEDTSFYRHHRLASLCEVGGDPRRFGTSPAAFHHANADRARHWPHAMLTTATHDMKRGEDTRLRIHALSERAAEWDHCVRRWSLWNRRFKRGEQAQPAAGDEYLLYQTLVGTWPAADGARPTDATPWLASYRERLAAYAIKAVREGKLHSSWRHPNEEYESALLEFLAALLDPGRADPFLEEFAGFVARLAPAAALHGLAQTLLKLAAPGVPDVYQGSELWDLSLADPDNRRPVDFEQRRAALAAAGDGAALWDAWPDGRVKLWLTARLLRLRREQPALLRDGAYLPLAVEGAQSDRLVAFARHTGRAWLVALAPRLATPLLATDGGLRIAAAAWDDTFVRLPDAAPRAEWRDALTGARIATRDAAGAPILRAAEALAAAPLAALHSSAA